MKFWARTITVMIASIAGGAMSHAAELSTGSVLSSGASAGFISRRIISV